MRARLTDEEVGIAVWEIARKLGHSREELDGMLKVRTPREVLRRLEARHNSLNHRLEREDKVRWAKDNTEERAKVFSQEQALNEARLRQKRAAMTLDERVRTVLVEARLVQEGTKGSHFDTKTVSGHLSAPLPSLADEPLLDQLSELFQAVIERAERELDRVTCSLPVKDWADRNKEILACPGSPEVVAIRFGVSESHVRKQRNTHGLRASDGSPKVEA